MLSDNMAGYCYLRLGGLAGEDGDMSVESFTMYTLVLHALEYSFTVV